MQVSNDDVLDVIWVDADRLQSLTHRRRRRPAAAVAHLLAEAGVDDEDTMRSGDRPDEVGERLDDVVRIAADVVLVRRTIVMAVADGEDFVDVVTHGSCGRASRDRPRP